MDLRIKKIIEYVDENLDSKLTLKKATQISKLSPSRFCELFKNDTKICFSKYIIRARIKKACELLRENSLSIKQISYKVGYSYISNFNHDFKKLIGISPSKYIKKQQNLIYLICFKAKIMSSKYIRRITKYFVRKAK